MFVGWGIIPLVWQRALWNKTVVFTILKPFLVFLRNICFIYMVLRRLNNPVTSIPFLFIHIPSVSLSLPHSSEDNLISNTNVLFGVQETLGHLHLLKILHILLPPLLICNDFSMRIADKPDFKKSTTENFCLRSQL